MLKHLNALRVHWKEHKAFPSMARLADVLGLASSGGVFKVIGRLVEAGYLERVDGRIAPTPQFFAQLVKTLYPLTTGRGWVLKPANPDYPDIVARQSLEILGVVVGLFRRYE